MGTGDTLAIFTPLHNEPLVPGNFANLSTQIAASGARPILQFDAATVETAIFSSVMPNNYDGGGVTVTVWYATDSNQTTDVVIWDGAFERVADGDLMAAGGSDFAAVQSVSDTADDVANTIDPATITFTDGGQMDSVVAGDPFRFKLSRDASNGSDTAVGNAELYYVEIKET